MIIVMKSRSDESCINKVIKKIEDMGYETHVIKGVERTVIGAVGDERNKMQLQTLENYEGVEKVVPILAPYKLVSKEGRPEKSKVKITDDLYVGGDEIISIAGPCSVESEDLVIDIAKNVKKAGANMLRGGAFKPRTSPYAFQGFGVDGLKILAKARDITGLPIVSEILDQHDIPYFEDFVDVIQVGARNMQNFALLKKLGKVNKPILLKRGMCAKMEEWLFAAEYILAGGNERVILCERGIRTFETATRNTLDLNSVPVLREKTHLPILIDPSHGTGHWSYVEPLSKASIAVGADGVIIEVHPDPANALSDGAQSLKYDNFENLIKSIKPVAEAVGRKVY